jgi:hypothetical protein
MRIGEINELDHGCTWGCQLGTNPRITLRQIQHLHLVGPCQITCRCVGGCRGHVPPRKRSQVQKIDDFQPLLLSNIRGGLK